MHESNTGFVANLVARARNEVARDRPTFWSWKDDGAEFAGVFVEKDEAAHEGRRIPVRIYHRLEHGDYRGVWLWDSPQRLRELHDELDPQPGDFVYIHVHEKRPKKEKPGEFWTPVDMHVTPATEVDAAAREVDAAAVVGNEDTETGLAAERDERDALVDDHGIRY